MKKIIKEDLYIIYKLILYTSIRNDCWGVILSRARSNYLLLLVVKASELANEQFIKQKRSVVGVMFKGYLKYHILDSITSAVTCVNDKTFVLKKMRSITALL